MCTYFFQIIHEIFDDFKLREFLLHKVILLKATSQAMFNRKQETKISYFLMKLKELRPIRKRKKKKKTFLDVVIVIILSYSFFTLCT